MNYLVIGSRDTGLKTKNFKSRENKRRLIRKKKYELEQNLLYLFQTNPRPGGIVFTIEKGPEIKKRPRVNL